MARAFFEGQFAAWPQEFIETSISPVLNKVEAFTVNQKIRNVLGQARAKLHFEHALRHGRIVIAKLAKGAVGEKPAFLMGSLLLARALAAVMARERDASDRRPFHIIIDEAQNFGAGVIATLLTDARKYAGSVTVATQFLDRLETEARQAVLGSTETLVCFRLGPDDARHLAPLFDREHQHFNPHVLYNLELGKAWCRGSFLYPDLNPLTYPGADKVRQQSRRHYARPRHQVEREVARIFRPQRMSFRITTRDIALLNAVARFRFLSSEQLHRIDGGSGRGVRNHLLNLTRAGYLVRVSAGLIEPFAYGLANKGARLLAERGYAINHRLDWSDKNERTNFFLAHTLQVAEVLLHFERAVADVVRLVDHQALALPVPQHVRNSRNPFCLRVTVPHPDTRLIVPVIPDRLFGLTYPDTTTHHFALELDRGTMDIWANRLVGKASFRRKLMAYAAAREQKQICASLGLQEFSRAHRHDVRGTHRAHACGATSGRCAMSTWVSSCTRHWRASHSTARWVRHGRTSKAGHVSVLHRMTGFSEVWPRLKMSEDIAPSAYAAAGIKRG